MGDKLFIGRCKAGKFPEQIDIGLSKEHLELLNKNMNDSGWVNLRLSKGRDSGKPYMEIITQK